MVEDTEDLAEAIARRLRRAGYAVGLAAAGGAADELLRTESRHLVVLDRMLPGPFLWWDGSSDVPPEPTLFEDRRAPAKSNPCPAGAAAGGGAEPRAAAGEHGERG